MRRPKHRIVRRGRQDEHAHDFIAHAPSDAFVRVAVTELEAYGTLVVELERIEGPVIVRWTDEQGKTQEVRLTHKET